MPWCAPAGKSPMILALTVFLATWARRLSWKQVSEVFRVGWDSVYRAVESVVNHGLAHRDLTGITAIGVDEVAYAKGHCYATLSYQLDEGRWRLLHVSEGREARSLLRFFGMLRREGKRLGQDLIGVIGFVCSDMWRAYLKVIRKKLPGALHILDRYHIVANLNKALDQVRADEARTLAREGWDVLKRAPVARSLREHRESILNWFRAKKRFNAGIVEGLNGLVKLRFRKAFGFRTFDAIQVALYHELAHLPEPCLAHRFC